MHKATFFFPHIHYSTCSIHIILPWWKPHFTVSFGSLPTLESMSFVGTGKGRQNYWRGLLCHSRESKCGGDLLGTRQTGVFFPFFPSPNGVGCFARLHLGPALFTPRVLSVICSYGFNRLLDVREDCYSQSPSYWWHSERLFSCLLTESIWLSLRPSLPHVSNAITTYSAVQDTNSKYQ